jgi:hypothetical protein
MSLIISGFSLYCVPYTLVAAFIIWGEIYLINHGKFKKRK